MDSNKTVVQYFTTARNQPLAVSSHEIAEKIQHAVAFPVKPNAKFSIFNRMNNAKYLTVGITGLFLAASILYLNFKTFERGAAGTKQKVISTLYQDIKVNSKTVAEIQHIPITLNKSNKTDKQVKEINTEVFSYTDIEPAQQNISNIAHVKPCYVHDHSPLQHLIVDEQTMRKLSIGHDSRGIRYHYYLNESNESIISVTVKGNRHTIHSKNVNYRQISKVTTRTESGADTSFLAIMKKDFPYFEDNNPAINVRYFKMDYINKIKRTPSPIFTSNIDGLFKSRSPYETGRLTPSYAYEIDYTKLVPVLVQANNADKDEALLWFEPTKDFLSILPADIAQEALEIIKNRSVKKTEALKAFGQRETLKEKLKKRKVIEANKLSFQEAQPLVSPKTNKLSPKSIVVQELKVFPNPATEWLNLEVQYQERTRVKIYLQNFNGKTVKDLQDFQMINELYSFDINEVYPGIYLLVIEPEIGKPYVRRIIIK